MLRVEVYVRALRASQNAKRSKVEAAKVLEEGRGGTLLLWYLAQPSFAYEDTRTEELAERRRANSVDHAGLEVEEHRAWCVLAARGLVVEHVNGVEMRVVVAKVLAAAANAVLVAQHLLKLGAHLTTALARLKVYNLARKKQLGGGEHAGEKGRGGGKM